MSRSIITLCECCHSPSPALALPAATAAPAPTPAAPRAPPPAAAAAATLAPLQPLAAVPQPQRGALKAHVVPEGTLHVPGATTHSRTAAGTCTGNSGICEDTVHQHAAHSGAGGGGPLTMGMHHAGGHLGSSRRVVQHPVTPPHACHPAQEKCAQPSHPSLTQDAPGTARTAMHPHTPQSPLPTPPPPAALAPLTCGSPLKTGAGRSQTAQTWAAGWRPAWRSTPAPGARCRAGRAAPSSSPPPAPPC